MIHNRCNQRCIFCNTQQLLQKGIWQETPDTEIRKQIKEASQKDSSVLFTGGGEVTMLKNLPELIAYARSIGMTSIGIETNAITLSYPSYTKALKASGLTYAIVSLHSHLAGVSDEITQAPGSYSLTMQGIQNLQKENIEISCVLHTLTSLNFQQMEDFVCFIQNRIPNLRSIGLNFIRPIQGDPKSAALTPRLKEVKASLRKGMKFCITKNMNILVSPGLGVPLCFLEDLEGHAVEFQVYMTLGKEEHARQSYFSEKVKGPQCRACTLGACCSGVNRNYAALYGTEELIASRKDLGTLIRKWKENIS